MPRTESRDTEPAARSAPDPAAARDEARRAAGALRVADAALGNIHGRLIGLAGLVRPIARARRSSRQNVTHIHVQVEATFDAIEDIVNTTVFEGRRLLRGDWSATLTDVGSGDRRSVCIPSLATDRTKGAPSGFVTFAGVGHRRPPRGNPIVALQAGIEKAAKLVSRLREDLAAFRSDVIEPLSEACDVALENVNAAANVIHDADFAVKASQLTQVDALLGTSVPARRPRLRQHLPVLPGAETLASETFSHMCAKGLSHEVQ